MNNEATELALVRETLGCRKCRWFWGPVPPYGPFNTFDFDQDYPPQVRALPVLHQKWLDARSTNAGQIAPAILHGCRKAPIMTLGINPNMGGFFATPSAANYAYPSFDREQRYAYYYRHRNVTQEQVEERVVRAALATAGRLEAPAKGTTREVSRSDSHRWVQIRVALEGGTETTLEFAWGADQVPLILAKKDVAFEQGEALAGVLDALPSPLPLRATPVSYYQRFEPVLRALEKLLDCPAPTLRVGEDVSQGDMVACASPGWTKDSYDIPRTQISRNCAGDERFILRQFLQSQPSVLIFVGRAALTMFAEHAPALPFLSAWKDRESFELLRDTTQHATYIDLEGDGIALHTRVLVAPHFSYSDNYDPGVRIKESAWLAFEREHPLEAARLGPGKVDAKSEGAERVFFLPIDPGSNAAELSDAARTALAPLFFDPAKMLAGALFEEIQRGNLSFDGQRLARAPGGCSFCTNERWTFPEGCPYPNHKERSVSNAESLRVARSLGKQAPPYGPSGAVRVWLGRRRTDVPRERFVDELRNSFVPSTVRTMCPLGLVAYLPTLVPEDLDPALPSELALVFYRSKRAYSDAMKTAPGRAYGALHSSIFQFPDASWSKFAGSWQNELRERQPSLLIEPPADWQAGTTQVMIARVEPSGLAELEAALVNLRDQPPPGLRGYIFVLEGDYFIRWALFDRIENVSLASERGVTPVHFSTSTDHILPLEPPAAPEAAVPLQPGTTLNMIFPRS